MEAGSSALAPTQLAKGALRRLAAARLQPTPENYSRAYREEAGESTADIAPPLPARAQRLLERVAAKLFHAEPGEAGGAFGQALANGRWSDAERLLETAAGSDAAALAGLIERISGGIERSGKVWSAARKKESLQRVLTGSRSDAARLLQRLAQLVSSWEDDTPATAVETIAGYDAIEAVDAVKPAAPMAAGGHGPAPVAEVAAWQPAMLRLSLTVMAALPRRDAESAVLAQTLADATRRLCEDGANPALLGEVEAACQRVEAVVQHHQRLFDQLGALCNELTASLSELAENDTWARGQCDAMRAQLDQGLTSRGVRSVSDLLTQTRRHQAGLRIERDRARDALKSVVASMMSDLGELGMHTGRFQDTIGRHAGVIEDAESLESLADVVREMVAESRNVHAAVTLTRDRLAVEHSRAGELAQVVDHLENELKRLSDEVSTDQLTQIANRRGLLQAFSAESARAQRGGPLAIGLLDIDNFKRLNDELGHQAGDTALKALAAAISQSLRPTDKVARYGGEEFVVLLPETPIAEAQTILTRLQRALSGGLFLHEAKPVLVTFSAGVTSYRDAERLEDAIERADRAMYEAKRTGKNRTCCA
jgi:diguanylate cyclase